MAITQVISQFPPAPDSQHDTATEFNSKADTFVHHQADTYVTEVNTWKDQANALEGEMNTIKSSIDTIVATIPSGSIDDTATATDKVWSSTKVSAELSKKEEKIESGTGYTKFPDGTLIKTGRISCPGVDMNQPRNGGFSTKSTEPSTNIVFDATIPFVAIPVVTITSTSGTGGSIASNSGIVYNSSTTGFVAIMVRVDSVTGVNVYGDYMAIGRWK